MQFAQYPVICSVEGSVRRTNMKSCNEVMSTQGHAYVALAQCRCTRGQARSYSWTRGFSLSLFCNYSWPRGLECVTDHDVRVRKHNTCQIILSWC